MVRYQTKDIFRLPRDRPVLSGLFRGRPPEPRGLNFIFVDPFRQSSRIDHNNPDAVRSN